MTKGKKISVIICTFNEKENLPFVLPKIPEWVDEVLLVDGHSQDNTVSVAKKLWPDIKILYQPKEGKGDALRYGFSQANGDIIVTLDADGSTNPEEMDKFIEPLLGGYDFVKGSRFLISRPLNKPLHRHFGNWLIVTTFNFLYGTRFTDLCSGYNAFRKKILEKVSFFTKRIFESEPLITSRVKKGGLRMIEVGHIDKGRRNGKSKESSWRSGFGAIKTVIRERFCE